MDHKRCLEDAVKLAEWADKNGQPDKPITFPAEMKKRVAVDGDGKWSGHPVRFLDASTPPKEAVKNGD